MLISGPNWTDDRNIFASVDGKYTVAIAIVIISFAFVSSFISFSHQKSSNRINVICLYNQSLLPLYTQNKNARLANQRHQNEIHLRCNINNRINDIDFVKCMQFSANANKVLFFIKKKNKVWYKPVNCSLVAVCAPNSMDCMPYWQIPNAPHSRIHIEFYFRINKIDLLHRI